MAVESVVYGESAVYPEREHTRLPHVRAIDAIRCVLASTLLLLPALPLRAQGCAQCLDSTRSAPPAVQAAYRHAIYLLGGTAASLFVAGAVLLRKQL